MAGLGKRLRPLTLHKPKALVEVHGEPLLRYALEETRGTDVKHVVCVISPQHRKQFEKYLLGVQPEFPSLTFHIREQKDPFGNGHVVLVAKEVIGNKPFAMRFPDDILLNNPPALQSLIKLYGQVKAPVLLLERVPKKDVSRYGVVVIKGGKKTEGGTLYKITGVVEKPPVKEAPSSLTIVGGYVLTPEVTKSLERIFAALPHLHDDALLVTAAFEEIIGKGKPFYGWEFPGVRLDCGTIAGFEKAEKFFEKRSGN